jgi:hypothetical protein
LLLEKCTRADSKTHDAGHNGTDDFSLSTTQTKMHHRADDGVIESNAAQHIYKINNPQHPCRGKIKPQERRNSVLVLPEKQLQLEIGQDALR